MTERQRHAGCRPRTTRGKMWGFGPTRRELRTGSFVSAKGPKTIGARAWPFGCLCPSPGYLGLRNSLRSDSPRPQIDSSGPGRSHARRRRGSALHVMARLRSGIKDKVFGFSRSRGNHFCCHARLDRASSVFAVAFFVKKKDKRIKTLDPRACPEPFDCAQDRRNGVKSKDAQG